MITVHRAVYGTRDGGHALLASDLSLAALPVELTGLVDRPPGSYTPGVRWSPFVACAPVGEWWALWRTLEDERGARAGAVQSHVALVPLKQVGRLPDIGPILKALPRELVTALFSCSAMSIEEAAMLPVAEAPSKAYLSLVTKLVSPRTQPVIYPDEGRFEEDLCFLWRHLWPRARERLACQMAFSPDAIAGIGPEVIVTTPAALASRWESYPLADPSMPAQPSGAPSLLYGTLPPAYLALQARIEELPGDLRRLVWFERAAEVIGTKGLSVLSLEELRAVRECIAGLAPAPEAAASLKAELITHLCTALPRGSNTDIRALANVDWSPFEGAEPRVQAALLLCCERVLPSLALQELLSLVKRATDPRYQGWWRETVQQGVVHSLRAGASNLLGGLWRWWGQEPATASWVVGLLTGSRQEESLLLESCPQTLPEAEAEVALQLAASKGWPRLHAAVVASAYAPEEAVQRHQAFPQPSPEGWRMLGERLPAPSRVQAARTTRQPELLELAAQAAVNQPELLAELDPLDAGWRALWFAVARAGIPWTKIVSLPRMVPRLVEALFMGEPVDPELLALIAEEPEAHLLDEPRRDQLWAHLPPSVKRSWQKATAAAWLQAMRANQSVERPEPALVHVILEQVSEAFDRERLGAQELLSCVRLFPELSEDRVTPWFVRLTRDRQFPEWVAQAFGKICHERRWKRMTERALDLFKSGNRPVEAMLEQCSHLLPFWSRIRLPSFSANVGSSEFYRALEEVVSGLYPEGPKQKDIWERAGGSIEDLPAGESGRERWHKALDEVRKGALLSSGIHSLLRQMLQDYPHNPRLKALHDITPRGR